MSKPTALARNTVTINNRLLRNVSDFRPAFSMALSLRHLHAGRESDDRALLNSSTVGAGGLGTRTRT